MRDEGRWVWYWEMVLSWGDGCEGTGYLLTGMLGIAFDVTWIVIESLVSLVSFPRIQDLCLRIITIKKSMTSKESNVSFQETANCLFRNRGGA